MIRGLRTAADKGKLVLGLCSVGFLLSSCLGTSAVYVSHLDSAGESTYFRLPSQWSQFSMSSILSAGATKVTAAQLAQEEATSWLDAFSALPGLKYNKKLGFSSSTPYGEVFAVELTSTEHDTFSYSTIRSIFAGADPLSTTTSTTGLKYSVANYSEFNRPGGYRGSELTFSMTDSKGKTVTIEQVGAVDSGTNWFYGMGIGCSKACFQSNRSAIASVINSWSVRTVS